MTSQHPDNRSVTQVPGQEDLVATGTVRGVSSVIGMALTPALGQLGDYDNGWRWAMVAMGVMSIISGILILVFVHEPERIESRIADDPDAGVFKWSDAAKLFKIPTLVGMALMLPMITSLVMFAYQSTYWANDLGYGVKNAAYLYTIMQLGLVFSLGFSGCVLRVSGRVADAIGLQHTFLYFVTLPYLANAAFWTIFYRIYPKDVARQAERTELIAQGRF